MFTLTDRQYQCCHWLHLHEVPDTRKVEDVGEALMRAAHLSVKGVRAFSNEVFIWGGKTGNRVKWRTQLTNDQILLRGFDGARTHLTNGDLLHALEALKPIGGLGALSYSSKHLRMLAPQLCGVFDSVVEEFLRPNHRTLSRDQLLLEYCDFCRDKAHELTKARVRLGDFVKVCDGRQTVSEKTANFRECKWTAADVDMACFAWLKNWRCVNAEPGDNYERCMPDNCGSPPSLPSKTAGRQSSDGRRPGQSLI